MKSKLNAFLQIMEGSWISQKTTYYLKINQIYSHQFKYLIYQNKYLTNHDDNINQLHDKKYGLQYYKNNIQYADNYSFNQNNLVRIKTNNNKLDNYKYLIYKDNCLKIQYTKKNIEYTEYINTINKKFTTSIAFLKKTDKYIAISFSSNIKIKEFNLK